MTKAIDVHTHIVPAAFPPYRGRSFDIPWPSTADAGPCHRHVMIAGRIYRTVPHGCWSVAQRLDDMARCGIGRQVLSPMPELLSYWLPLDDARAMTRFLNEEVARLLEQAPDRLSGLGCVPLQDIDAAIEELAFVCGGLRLAGVEIASHVNGVSIGAPRFEPFFAAAESMGAAVFVHALHPVGRERVVGPFAEQAVCFPGDIALAAASMITGGMAARHPTLRIAFSHGGGALRLLLPRLDKAWSVTPKAREALAESPTQTARRFFYDDLVFAPNAIRFLIDTFGPSQILLGSDYPFVLGDTDPVATLRRASVDASTFDRIESVNAMRFLAL